MSVPPDNVYRGPPNPGLAQEFQFQMVCFDCWKMLEEASQVVKRALSCIKDQEKQKKGESKKITFFGNSPLYSQNIAQWFERRGLKRGILLFILRSLDYGLFSPFTNLQLVFTVLFRKTQESVDSRIRFQLEGVSMTIFKSRI